jgi:hypothetical protein
MAFAGGSVEPTAWWLVRCAFIGSKAKLDGYLVIDANDFEYLRLHRRPGSGGKEKNAIRPSQHAAANVCDEASKSKSKTCKQS